MSGATMHGDPGALAAGGSEALAPQTDPHGFLLGRSHEAALQGLHRALQERSRALVLTGEPGSGRSSLLVRLATELGAGSRVVLCRGNGLDFSQVLVFLCMELELSLGSPTRTAEMGALTRFLSGGGGRRVVLIVDDADRLAGDALDQLLRLASGVSGAGDGFSLILSGGPGLQRLLKRKSDDHACLGGAMFTRLTRLDQEEATTLVEWVAERNAHRHGVGPSTAAIQRVVEIGQGNPANLARVYDAAVSLAVSEGIACVSSVLVDRAREQLLQGRTRLGHGVDDATIPLNPPPVATGDGREPGRARRGAQRWLVPTMLCVVLIVVVVIAVLEIRHRDGATASVETPATSDRSASAGTSAGADGGPASPAPVGPSRGTGESRGGSGATGPMSAASGAPAPASKVADAEPMPVSVDPPVTAAPVASAPSIQDAPASPAPQGAGPAPAVVATAAPALPGGQAPEQAAATEGPQIDSYLRRAEQALARDSLTTPPSDNAVLWAETALEARPGEPRALAVLDGVVERYLGWSNVRLGRNDLGGARRYLDRARTVQRHASRDQLAAMDVLDKAIADRAQQLARPARRSSGSRQGGTPPRWLEDVDSWLQTLPLPTDR